VLSASSLGVVTDVRIDEGHYAQAGQLLMTLISATDVWVQADIRENGIGNIKEGNRAEIALDVAPGRVFPWKVTSLGYGVGQGGNDSLGTLRTVQGQSGWLRDAQRFPVIIEFADDSAHGLRRAGGPEFADLDAHWRSRRIAVLLSDRRGSGISLFHRPDAVGRAVVRYGHILG